MNPKPQVSEGLRLVATGALLTVLIMLTSLAAATQPVRFNYQAKLTDANGLPLEGPHAMYFSIWSPGGVGTPNGGTQWYGEVTTVTITKGVANHVVGTGDDSFFGVPLDDVVFNRDTDILLQVAVDVSSNIILPRTLLQSVPFAVTSRSADTAANGVPAEYSILGRSAIPPAGFSATGSIIFPTWVLRTPMPVGTSRIGLAAVGGKLYAIGGNQGTVTNQNVEYDTGTNTWTTKASMFTQREHPTCSEIDGLIYTVGGYTPNGGVGALAVNEVYYPATNTWGTSQPMSSIRASHVAAVYNGKIYVFGGFDNSFQPNNTVEVFDPSMNQWTPGSAMPTPRYGAASAIVNGKVYVCGGITTGGANTPANEEYDASTDMWTPKAPMPFGISSAAGAALDGKIYVVGGYSSSAALTDTWIYDPASDTWTLGPPIMAAYRVLLGACTASGRIYAIGGADDTSSYGKRTEELSSGIFYVHSKN